MKKKMDNYVDRHRYLTYKKGNQNCRHTPNFMNHPNAALEGQSHRSVCLQIPNASL